jgi:hypothetical protein
VAYIVLDVEGEAGQSYQALGHEGTLSLPQQGPDTPGLVAVRLAQRWAYATGVKPAVDREGFHAMSPSTKLLVHTIDGAGGNVERVRAILLDGTSVNVAFDGAAETRELTKVDTCVDVWLTSAGGFDHFGDVAEFYRDATEGSEGVMDEVDAARAQHKVD